MTHAAKEHKDITIRALTPDDWEILRELRLKALKIHPDYFSSSAQEAGKQPPDYWQEFLAEPKRRVFGLFDGKKLIGITAISPDRDDTTGRVGGLHYNFIEPEYRGRGLANLFYEVRIKWALQNTDWIKIKTSHREGNEASRKAILRAKFVCIGIKEADWPDGTQDWLWEYELNLDELRG